jgi:hypothetical protein
MNYMAETNYEKLGVRTSFRVTHRLIDDEAPHPPPTGEQLTFRTPGGTIIKTIVMSSSDEQLTIQSQDQSVWRATRWTSADFPVGIGGFPGTDWVIRDRLP